MSRIKELRETEGKEEQAMQRADNSYKRMFGTYVDEVDEEIDSCNDAIDSFEVNLADCNAVCTEDFEEYVSNMMKIEQLKAQREVAKQSFEKLFGEKFRQVV